MSNFEELLNAIKAAAQELKGLEGVQKSIKEDITLLQKEKEALKKDVKEKKDFLEKADKDLKERKKSFEKWADDRRQEIEKDIAQNKVVTEDNQKLLELAIRKEEEANRTKEDAASVVKIYKAKAMPKSEQMENLIEELG